MRKIGVHTSIAGGLHKSLERAAELSCNTLQIFSHNPRGWAVKKRDPDEIKAFKELKTDLGIMPVFIHTSYLINLASEDRRLIKKSIDMVINEMNIADMMGAEYVVLHTGSASGENAKVARKRAMAFLIEISKRGGWNAGLLIENTAGEHGDITSKIAEISEIMEKVTGKLISGICLDTCHAFSAGYDIRTDEGIRLISGEIEKYIGKDKIRLIHLNDSKGMLGSGRDRHEHIGKGEIGVNGIKKFLNCHDFTDIPIILETPKKSDDDDKKNLKVVRSLIGQGLDAKAK